MKIEVTDKFGRVRLMNEKVARLLQKARRVTYLTRDMQAAPVTGPVVNGHGAVPVEPVAPAEPIAPPAEPVPTPPEPEQPPVDLDSDNTPWDPALHVASKLKNGDGTWRKRPGAKSAQE